MGGFPILGPVLERRPVGLNKTVQHQVIFPFYVNAECENFVMNMSVPQCADVGVLLCRLSMSCLLPCVFFAWLMWMRVATPLLAILGRDDEKPEVPCITQLQATARNLGLQNIHRTLLMWTYTCRQRRKNSDMRSQNRHQSQ